MQCWKIVVWELSNAVLKDCSSVLKYCSAELSDCGIVLEDCSAVLEDCSIVLEDCSAVMKDCSVVLADCGIVLEDCSAVEMFSPMTPPQWCCQAATRFHLKLLRNDCLRVLLVSVTELGSLIVSLAE